MGKVTIQDIAKQAGVSKTSVSFAFNNPDRLSEATLNRILKVAEELGYSPDPIASNLKTRRTGCIGLLVPQPIPGITRNPHTFELLEGIGQACQEAGLSMMLVPPLKGNLRRAIVRAAVDGFVTMGLEPFRKTMAILQQRGVPFVMVDSEMTPGIPCVNVDDEAGSYAAMSYILRHGHRRIAILGILSDQGGHYENYIGTLKRRATGYVRALAEFGMAIDQEHVRLIECKAEFDTAAHTFRSLWHSGWHPTAVVAMADVLAAGTLRAAREMNIRIPDDLSLIGYDDIALSPLTDPPLTTIHQPTIQKGRHAAHLLIDLIEGRDIESEQIVLPVELIERGSVRRI